VLTVAGGYGRSVGLGEAGGFGRFVGKRVKATFCLGFVLPVFGVLPFVFSAFPERFLSLQ